VLAAVVWPAPRPRAAAPEGDRWLYDRAADPPVPPTEPRLLLSNAIVVLITIDAMRADAVNDPRNDMLFPTLADMKRRGAWFSNASAPGSQTAVSLTTLFSGRYFSELRWADHGVGSTRFLYAAGDPAPRFPELLSSAGVSTSSYCGVNFIAGAFGVARGFQDERVIAEGRRQAFAKQVIDPLLDRLRRAGNGPLFLYAHLMEPHAPYDRGAREGTDKERYISEIAVADVQLGRVAKLLDTRFPRRSVLIVSADHGEAFGEHQTYEHTKTLYDELLRVPLLVHGAGVAPREIRERVGLVDLGPTILDLFGLGTPATFEGQSLVPVLAGDAPALDRPLIAEGRLRRALTTPDGLKVIRDLRREVVEVYDLARDPGELEDLAGDARGDRALARLDAFFAAHEARGGGYRPAYKP
jgi:arylsulfatase A-like enzyme